MIDSADRLSAVILEGRRIIEARQPGTARGTESDTRATPQAELLPPVLSRLDVGLSRKR
ncbi:MAG: hypothetical protein ACWGON_00610 [Gemmatimonadota bacterium]